ncbi:PREDICTED: zinc finger CCCH domain-containing protein 58-like isoform X1 [Camelina sativa]|uniref:Zinc finger CCCH domain-containing protein 58-like isoform X1 n=1 Tax=Camelina sativa TaxID=90675 RepID=A0ABM0T456_CAMSA|nr:PREDICTED: zinc finger CCCH domain-containing protein 58-like isoform X2 [Camelina sativa]XP_010420625.1 PREDICTED: zinc finger CCCH domain-containing protein 58-like isoform X1 [Camelina sativa]
MERYGGAGEEEPRSDPSLEWSAPGNETGIEASMWRLGLQGGGGDDSLPERPDEPDCIYFIRTGGCGYGSRCRFNHPPDRAPVLGGGLRTEAAGQFPERMGQPVCQHFMRTGTCKFGASCKYHHPRQGGGGGGRGDSVIPISLNYMGFPLRPGEKECSYFMRTGQCKFGSTCRFHHPVPPGVHAPSAGPTMYPSLQSQSVVPSSQQYGVVLARPQLLPGSYVPSPYGYGQMVLPPGMVPYSGWNPYQASVSAIPSPGTQPSMGTSSVYGIRPLSPSAPAYQSGPSSTGISNKEQTFPQRPEQPECQYFMRTGDCKFGSSCRFHHPMEAASPKDITLSHIGLPLRPGAAQCTHFAEHGVCKFGPACKFDHSIRSSSLSYNPSASSLTDMPVAPHPLGSSSLGTLAPTSSSSSSEQRTKLLSSSSIKPITTRAGGTGTVPSSTTSGVSHPEPAETNKDNSASIEAKTSG